MSNNSSGKLKKKPKIRHWIQAFFLIFVTLASLKKFLVESGVTLSFIPDASLHAICPFGGVVSLYQFLTVGTFVQKIHESSFVLMAAALLLALLAGPVLCGWVCPFGTFQEILGKLGKKLMGKKYNNILPKSIDRGLRYFRYALLAMVVYQTAITGKLMFQGIDPYYALFNLWSDELAVPALLILLVTIILSLFFERPWCKYVCPYGALLGITNLFRIFKIRRDADTCIQCGACDRTCPMNIEVSKEGVVKNHQCISCLECTSEQACPIDETVELSLGRRGKK